MEVFRYATSCEWQQIEETGALKPKHLNYDYQPVFAIPEHSLLWGDRETLKLIQWIEKVSGKPVEILMRFDISLRLNSPAYVQEGSLEPWLKGDSKKHVSFYKRVDYLYPEFVIHNQIPISEIALVEIASSLRSSQ